MTRSGEADQPLSPLHSRRKEIIMIRYLKLAALALTLAILAIGAVGLAASDAHVMAKLNDAKWGPAPPLVPPGAQIAVLSGDPMKAVPYTVRFKFPADYAIPAHSHPADENVAVVSGELFMGMGDKLDKTRATGLGTGAYALIPAGMNHFAFTKSETTILLFGTGPVDFKYVNPADDPRNKK
jgi:quercetin dioxygenase-like cupin family protein